MWSFGRQIVQKAKKKFRTGDAKKLVDLTDRKAGMISAHLYNGLQTFKRRIPNQALEEAWASGNWARVMQVIPWDDLPQDIGPALAGVGSATLAAGTIAIEALPPNVNKRLRWDMTNPILRKYVTDRTAKLVVGITAETQEHIQNAVARSFTHAMSPRETAKRIKSSIGLYPAQEIALGNYQMKLMSDNVTDARVDNMVSRYEDQLLTYRSKMIARTEMRGATNVGQQSVWQEAANQDLIDKNTARRVWICEGADPCEDCLELDGQETGIDEPWDGPDGPIDNAPYHPHCYCGQQLVL